MHAQVMQPGVGVASTILWHAPTTWAAGGWVRYLLNAVTCPGQANLGMPIGINAVRRELADEGAPLWLYAYGHCDVCQLGVQSDALQPCASTTREHATEADLDTTHTGRRVGTCTVANAC